MKNYSILLAIALLYSSQISIASIVYEDGEVHWIDTAISDDIIVRDSIAGLPTTLNLLLGGSIRDLNSYGHSQVNIAGGTVERYGYANEFSHWNITEGFVNNDLQARQDSTIDISGGVMGVDVRSYIRGEITISGGTFGSELIAYGESLIEIKGNNFDSYSFGPIPVSYGIINGTLMSGELINNHFQILENANIVLIPEPTSIFLLSIGGLLLRKKR